MSLSKYAPSTKLFDWLFTFFAAWIVVGVHIDGWAHTNLGESLESFFTPWHALFYAGIFATGACLVVFLLHNHARGYPLRYSLPKEYMFSLVGIIIMGIAGVGDMVWHELLGTEVDIEALFSPTHLLLAVGGATAVAGPLHGVWYRHSARKIHDMPTILSTLYFMSIITFMLQFLHPFAYPWVSKVFFLENYIAHDLSVMLGMAGILSFSVIFVGIILSTIRHWTYSFGSFTIILSLNAALVTFMYAGFFYLIWAAVLAGLLIDLLYWILINQRKHKPFAVHFFCFAAPALYAAMYIACVMNVDDTTWSVHTWTGAIIMAGIVGYLMSYLVIPAKQIE